MIVKNILKYFDRLKRSFFLTNQDRTITIIYNKGIAIPMNNITFF